MDFIWNGKFEDIKYQMGGTWSVYTMRVVTKSILVFLLLVLSGCSDASDAQLKYKFNDSKANELLIKELKREGIRYSLDDDGWIRYSIKDQNEVDRIVKKVTKEYFVPETSISYTNPDIANLFIKKLKEEGIKYELREQDDRLWVIWNKDDDESVRKIKKEINTINLQ